MSKSATIALLACTTAALLAPAAARAAHAKPARTTATERHRMGDDQ